MEAKPKVVVSSGSGKVTLCGDGQRSADNVGDPDDAENPARSVK